MLVLVLGLGVGFAVWKSGQPGQPGRTGVGNGPAELVLEFGGKGTGPGLLDDPRRIAVDGSGHLWVADYGDGRLQEFDPPGSSCG